MYIALYDLPKRGMNVDICVRFLKTAEDLALVSLGKSPLAPVPHEEKGDRSNSLFAEN